MADRLISADALKRKLCRRKNSITDTYGKNDAWVICLNEVLERIDNAPTIDAEPIKPGRWVWNKRLGEWYCSNCDRIMTPYIVENSEGEYEMAQPYYCGWCGAKMDEVEE